MGMLLVEDNVPKLVFQAVEPLLGKLLDLIPETAGDNQDKEE